MPGDWWTAPLVLIGIRFLLVEATLAHAQLKKGTLVFRGSLGFRLIIGGSIVAFSAMILTHLRDEDRWALAGIAAFVVLFCFVWPGTVTINDAGVEQHLWWRRTVRIPWSDVTAIEKSPNNDYFVYSVNGGKIAFDRFHVDGFRFRSEVQRRARLKEVIDSTAPPTLRA
jgi:hypothetical protein